MKLIKLFLWTTILICFGTALGMAKDKADVRDITGCLAKGDSAKEFLLTGNDGSTWEVRSGKVASWASTSVTLLLRLALYRNTDGAQYEGRCQRCC